jgi:cation diffusion facilitator CzcD-associated flavoprotein CzcO
MSISAIIIGAGPSGVAMAHKLKHELQFNDFTIYEKLDGVGGTWRANSYPGWCVLSDSIFVFFNLSITLPHP